MKSTLDETRWQLLGYRALVYGMATVFLATGIVELAGLREVARLFDGWGLPGWAMPTVGGLQVVAALVLAFSRHAYVGAIVLAAVMIGATATHIATEEQVWSLVPMSLLIGLAYVFYRQAPQPSWTSPETQRPFPTP